ncbi:hypothetical protein A1359_04635 [Methylomonas lenta]|uniref:PgaA membrane beta barrel domain-containing protein n=1 Tax=Methylomonas lenta TaxID=980561 RepID=A0A177NKW0_9GAMM|nr:tetratricopeptide repeat protein [Methylomonas lenta]OAI18647.1 hypothetical protein A1359_04635 [Methylomonas lenta]
MNRKIIAIALWLPAYSLHAKQTNEATYQQALEQARSGQTELALEQLRLLVTDHPRRKQYLYDYLQLLLWAERDDDVLREAEGLNLKRAPAYVLETIAKSARNKGQLDKATELYSQAAKKTPNRLTPNLGIGLILLDQKQTKAAIAHFNKLAQNFPDNFELTLALASALEQDGQTQAAEQLYQQALTYEPDNKNAAQGLIRTQSASKDFTTAIATANTHRQALNDEEWTHLNWDYATDLIRQGERDTSIDPTNFAKTDLAIQAIKANLAALATLNLKDLAYWQTRAEADLLVALHDRKQMSDVITRFRRLQQQNLSLPAYAKMATANAFADQNQTKNAQALYQEIIQEQPKNYTAQKALAKISLDMGDKSQLDNSLTQLSEFANSHPDVANYRYDYLQYLQWSGHNAEVLTEAKKIELDAAPAYILETIAKAARELHDYPQAEKLYTMAASKAPDRLTPQLGLGLLMLDQHNTKLATRHFDELASTGQQNSDILFAQAAAHEMAGHPKQASQLYQKLLNNQPQHTEAARGLIRTLASAGLQAEALQVAKQHRSLVPDDLWVDLNWHHAAELVRRGKTSLNSNPDNFHYTDQAIAAINANIKSISRLAIRDKKIWLSRAQADLLVALHDRQLYNQVNDEYEVALDQNLNLPTYALLAVADSQLKNNQPTAARELYLQIFANEADNLDAIEGLMRTYLATGQTQDIAPILIKLQTLAEQNPSQPRYRYDLLQGLSWLERDTEVLQQALLIDKNSAPVYILETVGRSARNTQDYPLAENLYSLAADKAPDRLTPKLALAGLMLDQQQALSATTYLQQLRVDYPNDIELILTQASAEELAGQYLKAVDFYQQALELQPTQPNALRGKVFALSNAGQTEQALTIAEANRTLFNNEEWAELKWSHAAGLIRQGEQALSQDARDYRSIDQAINELQSNIALVDSLQLKDPLVWRQRAQFDLLVAFRDRRRMDDTIALYQQLLRQNTRLPVYARMAAADAYLNNRQPEQARELYLSVLQEVPDYYNAKASLAYAYLEAEQPDLALATAEQLSKEQPETISLPQTDGSEISIPNPKKATADMTAAIFHAYVDDLNEAQSRLERLHLQYPDNTDIHSKLAEVYYFRGWPRKAQHEIDIARQQAPEHFGLKLNQAKVSHELRDYPAEQSLTNELYSDYPEDSGALKQMQAWKRHNKPELKIFANGGISKNEPSAAASLIGNDEINIDSIAYSQPIAQNFRLFAHNGWKTSSFKEGSSWQSTLGNSIALPNPSDLPDCNLNTNPDDCKKIVLLNNTADLIAKRNWQETDAEIGNGYLRHYGVGVEFTQDKTKAGAEIHYDNSGANKVGVDLDLEYQFNDHWQLFTHLSSLDNNIPVRALKYGVTAKSALIGFTFKVNESRQFNLSSHYYNFSSAQSTSCNSVSIPEIEFNSTVYSPTYLSSEQVCDSAASYDYLSQKYKSLTDTVAAILPEKDNLSASTGRAYDEIWSSQTVNDFIQQTQLSNLTNQIYNHSNNRYALDGNYFERWYSGPIYKFSTILGASFSANTSTNVFYYSPKKDATVALTLDNDWLTYRNYETDFHQRVALTAGDYWQEDYGSNMIGNIQYEHRWHLGSDIELIYGGNRSYRYYDNALTQTWQMYLTADIRF